MGDGCCIADDTKCLGVTVSCDAGYFKDASKNGNAAGSTDADKKTNCCTDKATCNNYESQIGTTSGANKFQTPVMIFVFAVLECWLRAMFIHRTKEHSFRPIKATKSRLYRKSHFLCPFRHVLSHC